MKHLLGCLLLSSLYCLSSWGTSGLLVVTQSPPEVTVAEGETVQIQCCWSQNSTRATLEWLKDKNSNVTIVSKTNRTDLNKSSVVSPNHCQPFVVCYCSNLTLSKITINASGLYTCRVSSEIPKLLQSEGNGTKLTVIKQVTENGTSGLLVVTQFPREVTVAEGDTVQIQCCWSQNFTRATLEWLKDKNSNVTTVSKTNRTDLNKSSVVSPNHCQPFIVCYCSNLTLSKITINASGLYTCRVSSEIPKLLQSEGNGTKLTVIKQVTENGTSGLLGVTVPPETSSFDSLFLIIPLTVLSGLLLVALTLLIVLRKQCAGRLERATSVIYEVPNHRSTELHMVDQMDSDGSSDGSSRGSTQWCQVQLYESINYFDVENNKNRQDKE